MDYPEMIRPPGEGFNKADLRFFLELLHQPNYLIPVLKSDLPDPALDGPDQDDRSRPLDSHYTGEICQVSRLNPPDHLKYIGKYITT